MNVNIKNVKDRRAVRYGSLDDLVADAERLAEQRSRVLGNWTQAQIYGHLALSLDSSIDGLGFTLPLPLRWYMSFFKKRTFLTRGIPAGFPAPERFVPEPMLSVADALKELRRAVARQKSESKRVMHPAFGNLSREEWEQFHLRHAELHMSFLVPAEARVGAPPAAAATA